MSNDFEENKRLCKELRKELQEVLDATGETVEGFGKIALMKKIIELLGARV
jgi:hypothetical protein